MAARRPSQRLAAYLASPSTRFPRTQFASTRRWLSSSAGPKASRTSYFNYSALWLAAVALGAFAPLAYKMVQEFLGKQKLNLLTLLLSGRNGTC